MFEQLVEVANSERKRERVLLTDQRSACETDQQTLHL